MEHPLSDQPLHFAGGFEALRQHRSGHLTFAVPTHEVNLADARAQSAEERGCRGVCELRASASALSDSDQDQEKRPRRTLGTPPVDSQKMSERCLVVSLTDLSTTK